MRTLHCLVVAAALAISSFAQTKPTAEAQSSFSYSKDKDGGENIEIKNVSFELTDGNVPGLPAHKMLLLRKTTTSKRTLGDIGEEATITLEAWPLGTDLRQKPLYSLRVTGTDGHVADGAIFVASRGTEEEDWWSIYRLGNAQHLFDTYLPLLSFSISRETLETRYVGLQIPEDDEKDGRLKKPTVVGVLTYASAIKVLHKVLITADTANQAAQFRSLADESRTLTYADSSKGKTPAISVHLTFSNSYPSLPNTVEVVIPVQNDDLDVAHATLPPHLHLAAFQR